MEALGPDSISFRAVQMCIFSNKRMLGYDNIILVSLECCGSPRQEIKGTETISWYISGVLFYIKTSFLEQTHPECE